MKYYAEKGSNKRLAVQGAIFAGACGSTGFNEMEIDVDGNISAFAKGYREDSIPENIECVEITEEMKNKILNSHS